jgi:transcriptional regulator with XRE-family HTH domain
MTAKSTPVRYPRFGERVRAAVKASGLTRKEISNAIGVGVEMVRRYEAGIARPELSVLASLCRILGTTPAQLLDGTVDGFIAENPPFAAPPTPRPAENTVPVFAGVTWDATETENAALDAMFKRQDFAEHYIADAIRRGANREFTGSHAPHTFEIEQEPRVKTYVGAVRPDIGIFNGDDLVAVVEVKVLRGSRMHPAKIVDNVLALGARLSTLRKKPLVFCVVVLIPDPGHVPTKEDRIVCELEAATRADLIQGYCALSSTLDLDPVATVPVDRENPLHHFVDDLLLRL